MRVALDISTATPRRTGVGHTTYQLAARLPFVAPDAEFLYLFHSLRQPVPRFVLFRRRRVRIRRRRIPGPLLLLAWEHLGYPSADVLARDVDLYHAAGMFVPPRHRLPLVTTIHDLFFLDHPELADHAAWGDAYLARTLAERLKASTAIICPSHITAAQVRRHFGDRVSDLEHRLSIIPWGVAPRWFLRPFPDDRTVLSQLGIKSPYILSIVGSSLRKNVSELLKAFRIFADDFHFDGQLVCVGLRNVNVQGSVGAATSRYVCLPYVGQHELGILMRNATLFVSASLMEGFRLPVLEAMAAGVPVVTTPHVGALDFTGPSSAVVTTDVTAEALAFSMTRVLGDGDLKVTLVRHGKQAAASLTWRRTARETLNVYEKAIKS